MDAITIADWTLCKQFLDALPYGKTLPTAIYLHRDTEACRVGPLAEILSCVARQTGAGDEFNVVKIRKDEPRLSLLSYPGFFDIAHPSLEQSVAVDLVSGRSLRSAYQDSLNPPILHRKELLLPSDDHRSKEFAELSAEEELAGLYSNTATIGFRVNWERLLDTRGVAIEGHRLIQIAVGGEPPLPATSRFPASVDRHKTALTRYQLSRPVKTLIEYDLLPAGTSFLDYGCGLGADIRRLRELGFEASGWDPVHAPDGQRAEADVVNLGYVLNVIEDPAERLETLACAWRYAQRLLVVSTLIGNAAAEAPRAAALNDGVLTQRNTFQKYFGQQELQCYIEDALDTPTVPIALGIFIQPAQALGDGPHRGLFFSGRGEVVTVN